jgi:hypothetical protein
MERPRGITASAIVSIAGSLCVLLLACLMIAVSRVPFPEGAPQAPLARASVVIMGPVLLAFSLWGIAAGVGLLRLRAWSRISMLVFSGMLAVGGVSSGLMMLLIPMPATPNAPQGIMSLFKIGAAAFYLLLAGIAAISLYFFTRPGVRARFVPGAVSEGTPVGVIVVASYLFLGAAACLGLAALGAPATLPGFVVTGWGARPIYLALGATQLWLAVGLLRLRPLSRTIAIAFLALMALTGISFALRPRLSEVISAALPAGLQQSGNIVDLGQMRVVLLVGPLWFAISIWLLVRARSVFVRHSV